MGSKSLRAQVGEGLVRIAQCDRTQPVAQPIRFQQENEVAIVDSGNARDVERRSLLFVEEYIQLSLQFPGSAPVHFAFAENERLTYDPWPCLCFQSVQWILLINRIDLASEDAAKAGQRRMALLLRRHRVLAEPDQTDKPD